MPPPGCPASALPRDLYQAVQDCWSDALAEGEQHGYKNSQVTVLAPTGTIGFMMDCDTTGVEPDIALVKYKKLVGGGLLKIVNQTVPEALTRLGYGREEINEIIKYIDENETIEGAPYLKEKDLPVFDCAFKPMNGDRSIHYSGHLKMMGAVQPFLSGAISKTVNMPEEASVDQIQEAYVQAWRLGLKALAIYRDGSKRSQPLNTSLKEEGENGSARPARLRLPDERQAITHKFSVAGHDGYLTVGMYDDGTPGEIFVVMAKQGSVVSGLMDTVATSISMALQYGVPLKVLVDKFSHSRFEPAGFTNNPQIPHRQVDRGLHLPLARPEIPDRRGSTPGGKGGSRDRHADGRHGEAGLSNPGGCPALPRMRLHHGAKRRLLQVPQLRSHQRLQLILHSFPSESNRDSLKIPVSPGSTYPGGQAICRPPSRCRWI